MPTYCIKLVRQTWLNSAQELNGVRHDPVNSQILCLQAMSVQKTVLTPHIYFYVTTRANIKGQRPVKYVRMAFQLKKNIVKIQFITRYCMSLKAQYIL